MADLIRIGVSSCLLGEKVRFDGSHKHDRFVSGVLGAWVETIPVCPEMELGLGAPREPIHLTRREGEVRLVGTRSAKDLTTAMQTWATERTHALTGLGLDGFILKSKSPSCGLHRVKVHEGKGKRPTSGGRGVFAEALSRDFPDLPLEEDGRLHDPRIRENFVERVFAHHRLRAFFEATEDWTLGSLVAFHTAEKMLLMAHHPQGYRTLGRLIAEAKGRRPRTLEREYRSGFMAVMARMGTVAKHTDVLRHMAGHFKRHLDSSGRAELAGVIDDYRAGLLPLVVPMTLIRHFTRRFGVDYLAGQTYLEPHPKELMLRNHV